MKVFTVLNEILDGPVEAEPVAFAPQPHGGGVVASLALVRRARAEQLPPRAQHQWPRLAQREAVARDVDEARVDATARESPTAIPVPAGVRFVPVIGRYSDREEAQSEQRKRETGVQQPFTHRHRSSSVSAQAASAAQHHQHLHPINTISACFDFKIKQRFTCKCALPSNHRRTDHFQSAVNGCARLRRITSKLSALPLTACTLSRQSGKTETFQCSEQNKQAFSSVQKCCFPQCIQKHTVKYDHIIF